MRRALLAQPLLPCLLTPLGLTQGVGKDGSVVDKLDDALRVVGVLAWLHVLHRSDSRKSMPSGPRATTFRAPARTHCATHPAAPVDG